MDKLRVHLAPLCLAVALAVPAAGRAQPAADPDWPCVQILVPNLSPAMIWAGPPLDAAENATEDAAGPDRARIARDAAAIAGGGASRDAIATTVDAVADRVDGDRNRALTLLFAAVFDQIDEQRRDVIAAIRKYARAQRGLLARIDADLAALEDARAASPPDAEKTRALAERVAWNTRIFDDRRRSLTALCEQPALLERKLGVAARTIQARLD